MKIELVNKEVRRFRICDLMTGEDAYAVHLLNEVLVDDMYLMATKASTNEVIAYDLCFTDIQRFFPVTETEREEYLKAIG